MGPKNDNALGVTDPEDRAEALRSAQEGVARQAAGPPPDGYIHTYFSGGELVLVHLACSSLVLDSRVHDKVCGAGR